MASMDKDKSMDFNNRANNIKKNLPPATAWMLATSWTRPRSCTPVKVTPTTNKKHLQQLGASNSKDAAIVRRQKNGDVEIKVFIL